MKYIRHDKESKVFVFVCVVIMLILIASMILDLCGVFDRPVWVPVAEYPFTNQHIQLRGWIG